jgi:ParB family chromosome partitioning protein
MTDILHLDPALIDAQALPRDRTRCDPTAMAELQASILATGLRQPVEVWRKSDPEATPPYGLISGLRRLTAHVDLGLPTIPVLLRAPADIPDAMAQMIAENEIRAQITPWEKGRILVQAVEEGLFPNLDAALPALFPNLDRNRRSRLRAVAEVVAHFGDDILTEPTRLAQQQLLRLSAALRAGLGEVIETALAQSSDRSPEAQWRLILPILEEHDHDERKGRPRYRTDRPRHFARPRNALVVRRERHKDGWILRFTGRDATGPLMEDIMDFVEDFVGTR